VVRRALGFIPLAVTAVIRPLHPGLRSGLILHRARPCRADGAAPLAGLLDPGHRASVTGTDEEERAMGIKSLLHRGKELAEDHADQIKAGIDKVEGLADKATKGKYTEKIEAAGEKLEKLVPDKDDEPDEPTQ
jgi:hypothetical protein